MVQRIRRWAALSLALLALVAAAPALAQQQLRGVALVIGNSEYEHLPALANPQSDARAIEALLSDLGFETELSSDRDARRLARDLDTFAEDAEGADVAVLYYAGHGIEAGGENFLVPVDADLSALDAAGEKLVPIADHVRRLRETVAVTIVLLDACRDNPFPPGATLKLAPGAAPQPVAAAGLALPDTRGAAPLSRDGAKPTDDSLGIVVGFAAEPGKPALDGKPGENSPYAAAVLKHLSAMAGAEFGQVMRMVGEEVYLRTGGAQRPWVNESLRRLLYFGEAPREPAGAEGDILRERRQLLLTIADLPTPARAQAENLARTGRVPMSVVYAMMQAAGIDPGEDPTRVEARLKAEIERFAEARAARGALMDPDPEIGRLTRLADEAEFEGALNAADTFREQAKGRVASLRETRQDQLQALRQRFVEDAEVFARSAETKKLLFRFDDAARDFGGAREIVADIDPERAARYLDEEIGAWLVHTELRGGADALATAEKLARDALSGNARMSRQAEASLRHKLALMLMLRAVRSDDGSALSEAQQLFDAALADSALLPAPERARFHVDYGRAVGQLALAQGNLAGLEQAEAEFARGEVLARDTGDTATEIEARFRQVQSLYFRWTAAPTQELRNLTMERLSGMIALLDSQEPDVLSARYIARATQMTLDLAMRQNTPEALTIAGEVTGLAAGIFDAGRFPLIHAEVNTTAARIMLEWAERFGDASALEHASSLLDSAGETFAQAGASANAQEAHYHRALTLIAWGRREASNDRLEEAASILRDLSAQPRTQADPNRKWLVDYELARIGSLLGQRTGDVDALRAAIAELERIRAAIPAGDPQKPVRVEAELGKALAALGRVGGETGDLRAGAEHLARAISAYEGWGSRQSNAQPFAELYQEYANAAVGLALATAETEDVEAAIPIQSTMHEIYGEQDNVAGRAVAANGLAYLLVTALRIEFDEDRFARAEQLVAEARDGLAAMPHLAGYVENTACEIRTEQARHEESLDSAKAALAQCGEALRMLTEAGQQHVVATAEASVERAGELVEELEDR